MKRSWIRQLCTRPVTLPIRRAPCRVLLDCEVLEDRTLPSALNLIGAPDGGNGPVLPGPPANESGQTINIHPGAVPFEVMGPQGKVVPLMASGPPGYTPQQLQTAYGLNQVNFNGIKGDGAGQTIALVEGGDNPSFVNSTDPNFAASALHTFDVTFGLPDPPSFTKVNQDGLTGPLPPPAPVGPLSPGIETALDVEWAHAMAPRASIIVVEASTDVFTAAATAGKLASVVSMSFVYSEGPEELSFDTTFQVPGVTYLAATGDYGAPGGYAAYSPHVVAVGGTTLSNLNSNGDYPGTGIYGETGWSLDPFTPDASGGGISQYEPEPSYQYSVQSTGHRTIPDISVEGDPITGVPLYDPYDLGAQWAQYGGTSLSAPLLAGMVAIADQGRLLSGGQSFGSDEFLTALYSLAGSNPSDFHDILYGNNGFNAGPGYDYVTGLGTPNGSQLLPDLAYFGLSTRPTLTSIVVTPGNPSVGEGLTEQFTATGTFAGGLTQDVTSSVSWTSATPAVATISDSGLARTLTVGTSVITASLNGVASPGITLTSLPLVSLAVTPNNPSVPVLLSVQFTATGTYSDSSTHDVTGAVAWASATPAVATVSPTGLATANALGTSVITASLYGVTSPGDVMTAVAPSFVVNTTADDLSYTPGKTSLREAILAANAYPGHAITFDPAVFATARTITLTLGELELTDTTGTETITGPAAGVTVKGGRPGRVFHIDSGVTAVLSGMTITGGNTDGEGGGLFDDGGTVTLSDCTISGNSAFAGGGLGVELGTATLNRCNVSGNSSSYGGGLFANLSMTTLTNCTVSGNSSRGGSGGGLLNCGTAALTDCTVSGNSANYDGGGLLNFGTLTLTDCTVSGNSVFSNGGGLSDLFGTIALTNCTVTGNTATFGGGLHSFLSSLALTDCTISGNSANYEGGGIYSASSTAALTNCTVSGNTAVFGGGLDSHWSSLTLTSCTFSGNSAVFGGGGLLTMNSTSTLTNCIFNGNSVPGLFGSGGGLQAEFGTTVLTNCTISGNSADYRGGGLASYDDNTTLTDCTVSGNSSSGTGGGVKNGSLGLYNKGMLTLTDCTVSDNSAQYGGGVWNQYGCTATLTNCTVSGNSAQAGGGVWNDYGGAATLTNCTVSGNSAQNGGGLCNFDGTVTLGNTIVAANRATSGPDGQGAFVSRGHNLIGATDGSTGWLAGSDLTGTSAHPLNPLLASLGNYGGPTQTMYLLPGSQAIDAGSNALIPADVTTDQRGLPRKFNGTVDIGAVETQGSGAMVFGNTLYLVGGNTNDQLSIKPIGASQTGSTGVRVTGQLNNSDVNQTYTQAFTAIYVIGLGGNDSFQFAGSLTVSTAVTAGDGNDNVKLGNGNNSVMLGNGNDIVQLGNGNNVVVAGSGNDTIKAGDGTNTVTAGAPGSIGNIQVQLGNGANDIVRLYGNGNKQVNVGDGSGDSVTIVGDGNENVQVGDGSGDSVTIVGNGNKTIKTGKGTGSVTITGTGKRDLHLGGGWTHN